MSETREQARERREKAANKSRSEDRRWSGALEPVVALMEAEAAHTTQQIRDGLPEPEHDECDHGHCEGCLLERVVLPLLADLENGQ